ncbi:hypothetical protein DFH09DRAFT_1409889, partial [Mycena vulgaris]
STKSVQFGESCHASPEHSVEIVQYALSTTRLKKYTMPSQCSECDASIHNSSSNDINVTTKTLVRQQELLTTNTPPEGAELTFLQTVVSDTTARLTDFTGNEGPWVLAQVSHRWRVIALSTPSLWSLFVINCSCEHANPLAMIKTQLNRAQKLKIHFYGDSEERPRHQIEMFQLLAEHFLRWEELIIELKTDIVPHLACGKPGGAKSIDYFQAAPSLLNVGINNQYQHIPIPLPASQLTRYRLDAPWMVHEGILKFAPNLVEVFISICFTSLPKSSTVIDPLSLRHLYVSHSRVLDSIRVPDLEELAVRFRKDSGPKVLEHVESRLVRSACSLRRICLLGSPDAHTTTEILRKALSVVNLTILLPKPDDSGAWLRSYGVYFFGCGDDSYIDYALYLGMLQSRWKARDCALKAATLLIVSGPDPDPATIDGLQSLHQDGLDLAVFEGPAHEPINRSIFA